jgi:hypothetical protein
MLAPNNFHFLPKVFSISKIVALTQVGIAKNIAPWEAGTAN